jgi:uncharacterized protein YndB with AHSA1/START domain
MSAAKKIGIAVGIVLAGILIAAALRPDSFRVERSTTIHAPPDKLYPMIDDFHQWAAWSPWEKLDPSMQRTHSGAENGKGAIYAWKGNDKVGAGRMEITQATPPSRVAIKLDFLAPFESHNVAEFTLAPEADNTRVTWAMHGPSPYVSKLFGLFVSMDSLIGTDFEQGLSNLKAAAEK